ncbi:MAG: cytochrome c biogenesis protein CcsA [Desulfocurvibacter africanus]
MSRAGIFALASIPALLASQWLIWVYAPMEQSMGMVQKIFYTHLPLAWWAMLSFFLVFACSGLYLLRRKEVFDLLAGASAELGVLFSGLALATGSIWGRAAWNVWWTWDPRLTTTLIMWFIYAAYLVLRGAPLGGERRAMACAVLGIVGFLDVPLVFYSARMWRSIHPAVLGSQGGGMEPAMWLAVLANLGAMGLLWIALLLLRYRQLSASRRIEGLATASQWD